jgi:endonuclease YncB( thermonuclease family)
MNWEKRKVLLSLWLILIATILVYKVFFEVKWNDIKNTDISVTIQDKVKKTNTVKIEQEKDQQKLWDESIIDEILSQEKNNSSWNQIKIETWDINQFTWNQVVIEKKIDIITSTEKEDTNKKTYKFSDENTIEFNLINKIFNWDTISLSDSNNNSYSVRLMWIDAPEILKDNVDCYAQESKKYIENISKNSKKIEFVVFDKDKYWRLIWILLLDWININDLLLQNWYVFSWTEYESIPKEIKNLFIASEQNAKKNKRWLRWNCYIVEDKDWIEREFDSIKRKKVSEYFE